MKKHIHKWSRIYISGRDYEYDNCGGCFQTCKKCPAVRWGNCENLNPKTVRWEEIDENPKYDPLST